MESPSSSFAAFPRGRPREQLLVATHLPHIPFHPPTSRPWAGVKCRLCWNLATEANSVRTLAVTNSPFSLLLLEMARSLQGAVRWVGESWVAKARFGYGWEAGGAEHLFSNKLWYHRTGYLCTSLREAAAGSHSVLQLTSASTSTSSWIVFRTAGSLGLPWQHCQRSRAVCFSWLGLNETSGATFWEGICSFKGGYIRGCAWVNRWFSFFPLCFLSAQHEWGKTNLFLMCKCLKAQTDMAQIHAVIK